VIIHGNGLQIGNLVVQHQAAKKAVLTRPLDVLVAMTQGRIRVHYSTNIKERFN